MSLKDGSGVVRKPMKQRGGIIGTLLVIIAAPMILNKFLGGGLRKRKVPVG